MAFPREFLDELISRSDIVDVVSSYVALTRKGSNYFGLCPFHNEKTGSFSVSPDKQIYHCFGCKHGGGVISFIMEIENLSFPDAVHFLAKRVNMEVPEDNTDQETARRRQRLLSLNKDAARWFYANLSTPEGAAVAQYLEQRRISRKTATNFGLGASPDSWDALITAMTKKGYTKSELLETGLAVQNKNGRLYDKFRNRLMFPVIDVRGDVVAFGGRVLDKSEPKYVNTQETIIYSKRRNLYGINLAKKSKRPNIILCEGNIDVITLHQAGFDYAVASLGTALTEEQAKMLAKSADEIIIAYDTDAAGTAATERAVKILSQVTDKTVRILRVPGGKDPDEFIRTNGAEAFERVLQKSEEQMDFRLASLKVGADMKNDEDRISYIRNAAKLLSELGSKIELEVYAGRVAEAAGVTRDAVIAEVQSIRKKRVRAEQKKQHADDISIERQLQPPRDLGVRYENPMAARAEEDLIALVADHPELAERAAKQITREDFTAPALATIFEQVVRQIRETQSFQPAILQTELDESSVRLLSRILAADRPHQDPPRELEDLCRVLRKGRSTDGADGEDPLMRILQMKSKPRDGG